MKCWMRYSAKCLEINGDGVQLELELDHEDSLDHWAALLADEKLVQELTTRTGKCITKTFGTV